MNKSFKKILLFTTLLAMFAGGVVVAADIGTIEIDNLPDSRKKAGVGIVKYPHTFHEKLFKCDDCHPKIFKDKIGANPINMDSNMTGNYCGAASCHNGVKAFPLWHCDKCHMDVTG